MRRFSSHFLFLGLCIFIVGYMLCRLKVIKLPFSVGVVFYCISDNERKKLNSVSSLYKKAI